VSVKGPGQLMPYSLGYCGKLKSISLSTLDCDSELAKFGHLHEMHVCDNVGDHLQGNVYARYEWEAEAGRAVNELNARWYGGE
jgi:hypothetical protein